MPSILSIGGGWLSFLFKATLNQSQTTMSDITENDARKNYCPMLGHELTFSYCRSPGDTVPCRKIIQCWWEMFDVEAYMAEHFNQETIKTINQPAKDKMATLYDLIQQAKNRQKS
jgi:hypothetical protein